MPSNVTEAQSEVLLRRDGRGGDRGLPGASIRRVVRLIARASCSYHDGESSNPPLPSPELLTQINTRAPPRPRERTCQPTKNAGAFAEDLTENLLDFQGRGYMMPRSDV